MFITQLPGETEMSSTTTRIEQTAVNTIRTLSMDAVQQAQSGHPGTPMALAPVVYQLWNHHLNYDPRHPGWPARDRFILSCGHASMLLYSVLHLAGVQSSDERDDLAISLDDIRHFRQLHSPCAGHPEFGAAAGIETTTGPLGQGLGNSLGMAIAGLWLAARLDSDPVPSDPAFDVYALCSDGDIMEGVSNEAASLAGHLQLSNLCWIYDDNRITIEGSTQLAFSEQVAKRFSALGWHVVTVQDANDLEAIDAALQTFKKTRDAPTLIMVRSTIGYGAPEKQNTAAAHGAPLGEDQVAAAKAFYDWPQDQTFLVPEEVRQHFADGIGARGQKAYQRWQDNLAKLKTTNPTAWQQLQTIWSGELPADWEAALPTFPADDKGMATRKASGKVLNAVADSIPWLLGGSADLAGSNNSLIDSDEAGHFSANQRDGRNFHFGIREHAMAAACNGMALCGLRPYAATFFVFTDYLRPSLRLAALMKQNVLYILTHDSIGLGEDGPTHQPIEHLAACRAIPNLYVFRPADANEVSMAYQAALARPDGPAALVLTRQSVPTLDRSQLASAQGVRRGGYVLQDFKAAAQDNTVNDVPDLILIGTGSEVHVCITAARLLAEQGNSVRVVSLPCFELFDAQPADYRESVLPAAVTARIAVEAGIRQGWDQYIGTAGTFIGMNSFGESAPAPVLFEHFGITVDTITRAANQLVNSQVK